MFSAAVDLLMGRKPPIPEGFAGRVVAPEGKDCGAVQAHDEEPLFANEGKFTVGVCAYLEPVKGAPKVVHSDKVRACVYHFCLFFCVLFVSNVRVQSTM